MKTLFTVAIAILALVGLAASASAQDEPTVRYMVGYDLGSKQFAPVVGNRISVLTGVAGVRGADLEAWFPVIGYTDQRASLGAALVAPLRLADNARLYLGAAGRAEPSAFRVSLIVGIEIR